MWDSVTVGGGVACFSLMNQITVAQNQSFARMLQKSKDPIPAFYVFTPCSCLTSGLHCVFMPFIFQVKAWASRETRNDKWSTRGQIVTHSDQWPVRSVSLANLVLQDRRGEGRRHSENWWVWLVWTEKGWATVDQLSNSHFSWTVNQLWKVLSNYRCKWPKRVSLVEWLDNFCVVFASRSKIFQEFPNLERNLQWKVFVALQLPAAFNSFLAYVPPL